MTETECYGLLMIVEDDQATRMALGTTFLRRGWDVSLAIDVADAMDQLDHCPEPDGIILDLTLPDGSGESVLRKVRDARLGCHVVVFTGTIEPLRLMRVRNMHPDIIIIKPIDLDVLCHLFDDWSRST